MFCLLKAGGNFKIRVTSLSSVLICMTTCYPLTCDIIFSRNCKTFLEKYMLASRVDLYINFVFSERALLHRLMTELHKLDSDVLVGHNISGFDLDVLLRRSQVGVLASYLKQFLVKYIYFETKI